MSSALNVYVSEIDPTGNALAVRLVGEADIETAPVLRGWLLRLLNRCQRHLVLDLGRLEFIDSTGISALIAGYQRAKQYDCQVCAAGPTGEVAKVFKLTALDTVIPCYQSVGQACEQRFHLDQATEPQAPVPIETFLMRHSRIERVPSHS